MCNSHRCFAIYFTENGECNPKHQKTEVEKNWFGEKMWKLLSIVCSHGLLSIEEKEMIVKEANHKWERVLKVASQEVCGKHQISLKIDGAACREAIPLHNDCLTSQAPVPQRKKRVKMTCNNLPDWSWDGVAALFWRLHGHKFFMGISEHHTHYLRLFKITPILLYFHVLSSNHPSSLLQKYNLWHYTVNYIFDEYRLYIKGNVVFR